MFISPHLHFESPLTGSTLRDLVARAHSLGRTHVSYTDIGTMTGTYKAYKAVTGDKKNPLKFIAGVELLVDFPGGYQTVTVHAKDQEAYQALVRIVSAPTGTHTSKKTGDQYPLTSPKELLELLKFKMTYTFSGPHSMVARPTLSSKQHEAALSEILKHGECYVALVAASEDATMKRYVRINGKTLVRTDVRMKTNYGDGSDVLELLRPYHSHTEIFGFYTNGSYRPLETPILFERATDETRYSKLSGGDIVKRANIAHLQFAIKNPTTIKVLITDYAFMATKEDKIVQDTRSENHSIQPDYYMMDDEEAKNAISAHGIPVHFIDQAIQNTQDWAKEFDGFKLKYDWRLPKITDKPTKVYILDEIRRVGRMDWKNPVWVARLKYEMSILIDNGTYDFGPYFFPIAGVFAEYKTNRRLTGPGRGSVTGSLMSYVMGITHIDPIDYDLPFERFFSMDRIVAKKLPDVDIDLPNRDLLVGLDAQSGLLYGTYGDKAAQVSTRGMLRLKSSIADVNRNFNNGVVDDNVKAFAESLPAPPQGVNDRDFVFGYKDSDGTWHKGFSETSVELQTYMASRPDEWAIVRKMLGIPRQHSRHASAFVIADVPVTDVIPTMTVNGVSHVTQYEAKEVESAGLIKYDFLSLSTLIDLEGCLNRINARNGKLDEYDIDWFDHEGVKTNIWRLPKTDDKTAKLLADGHLEALFQVGTNSMRPFVLDIQPKNIVDCAVVLALVRPGPLDYIDENLGINMAQKYVKLRKGELQPDNATLARLLPESYGVIVFQEQLTKIARDLAMMPGDRAEILRDNMCKKRKVEFEAMKPEFMEKATQNASKEDCEMIWNMMATFGQYGFSVNHATAYAAITWATAFLKAHYPLEFWASVLTNADNKEINEKYWKFVHSIVAPPDINVSSDQFEVDYAAQKVRSKMTVISGLGDKVMERVMAARPFDGIEDFVRKGVIGDSMTKKLIHVGVMDSLFAPDSNLIDKMQAYEDAVQKLKHEEKMVEYHDKVKTYEELLRNPVGKKPTKPKEPVLKRGTIDPKYLSMSPYEDYSAKKEVLPSMPSDLTKLTMDISSNISKEPGRMPVAFDSNGRNSRLVNGAICRIYENRQDIQGKRDFFACAGMVLSAKVFTMKKKGTQAFKLLLETDGHIRELVKWPDYDTNELKIPDLKKGDIVFCFFDQKPGRPPRIADIVVEYSAPKASKK